ncbi:MAG: hypothetical protein KBC49_04040 [Candidatus Pacebacteria bacterium]|jgi:hypothetical protein|nr:hypothetical protein [Candidatus Paceibacterota bacterium]
MESLQKYLDQQLEQNKKSLDVWLGHQKLGLQSALNKEMLNQIAYAEQQIEIGNMRAIEQFKKSMADLQKRRAENTGEFMQKSCDRFEKSIKHSFEVSLRTIEGVWKGHIEQCRANLK